MLLKHFVRPVGGGAVAGATRAALRRTLSTSALRPRIARHHSKYGGKVPPASQTAHPGWDRPKQDNALKTFLNSSGFETAAGASAGVLLLGVAAIGYNKWYKKQVLRKMDKAFEGGYDPILHLSEVGESDASRIRIVPSRPEQELADSIVRGHGNGRYYLFMGPKGVGKSSMFIQAMADTEAEGTSYFEAHHDLTVVLDRFAESINFSMNRDYLGSLLGLGENPSGTTTMQALERALHKLEQALIARCKREGRPAVIIMSAAHQIPDDEEGHAILRSFQQRAERWAANGTATFVFLSDDYRVYKAMRKAGVRMDTVTVRDLTREQSFNALRRMRQAYYGDGNTMTENQLGQVYRLTGGRLSILNGIARRQDMLASAHRLIQDEKEWLLSLTSPIVDHDDDVMDEQKWSTCSWMLFSALAARHAELEEAQREHKPVPEDEQYEEPSLEEEAPHPPGLESDPSSPSAPPQATPMTSIPSSSPDLEVPNPAFSWGDVRQIMTRPDYIEQLDHLNIIHIDRSHFVTADSLPMLHAFRLVADVEGFDDKLEQVMDRVSAIESLGRTRELLWKEQGDNGKFLIRSDYKGREVESWTLLGGDERLGREMEEEGK